MKPVVPLAILLSLIISVGGTASASDQRSRAELKKDFIRPTEIPFPQDNPYSADKAALGKMLFFDPRMSGSNSMSCATCHNPGLSWGDGLPRGVGNEMKTLARRTPTILNLAWAEELMWDGRKTGLEGQALAPVAAAVMNVDVDTLPGKLWAIPEYRTEFKKIFGGEGITTKMIGQAIATYERTVVSGVAPFDRWIAGDENAISEEAKHGFDLFNGKANCVACHSGWDLTDRGFHDIGLPGKDIGRSKFLPLPSMEYAFKTPTLRDIDRRGPYMHDGSIPSLSAVIEQYDNGGIERPSLSNEIHPLHLTEPEKKALVAFLKTLTAPVEPTTIPILFASSQ